MTPATPSTTQLGGEGLDLGTLNLMLEALGDFVAAELPEGRILELDHEDTCPEATVRAMCSDALGVQLVFIPEAYGGMGGNAFDSYRVCERMARVDIGLGTSVFATFLGSDPVLMGGTEEQRKEWLGRIAEQGIIFAYGATEPEAGSDLGAMTTVAVPLDGSTTTRRASGLPDHRAEAVDQQRQHRRRYTGSRWRREGRPGSSWSATPGVLLGAAGGQARHPAVQHCRAVPRRCGRPGRALVGGVEGRGLIQAQQVFGYTRVMVAAFGLAAAGRRWTGRSGTRPSGSRAVPR